MKITHVEIIPARNRPGSFSRLLCYAAVVLDDALVIKNVKLIDGPAGPFVQFPDTPWRTPCPACDRPADVTSAYCGECGARLPESRWAPGARAGRRDVTHPTRPDLRAHFLECVEAAYRATLQAQEMTT